MRVLNFLEDEQVHFELIHHAPSYSAHRRALRLHSEKAQILRSALLMTKDQRLVVVLPASHQINVMRLEQQIGSTVRFANNRVVSETFNDCEWGVVSPFGHLYGLSTIFDESVLATDVVAMAGHLHVQTIRMARADYEQLEKPWKLQFAVPLEEVA